MKASFVVVFDNAPADNAPWASSACATTKLALIDNDAIATAVSKSKEAQKIILESKQLPWGENPLLVPHYRSALEQVAAGKKRLGLFGVNWLMYAPKVDAVVLDLSALEAEGKKGLSQGISQKDVDAYVAKYSGELQEKAIKAVGKANVLVFPAGQTEAKKAEAAVAFLQKLDV